MLGVDSRCILYLIERTLGANDQKLKCIIQHHRANLSLDHRGACAIKRQRQASGIMSLSNVWKAIGRGQSLSASMTYVAPLWDDFDSRFKRE